MSQDPLLRRIIPPDPGRSGSTPDYRFTLANERTFLAWIRTALALAAGGLAVVHLMPDLWGREPLGISLMGLSLITAVASYRRWVLLETAIREGSTLPASRMPAVLAIATGVLGVVAAVILVVEGG